MQARSSIFVVAFGLAASCGSNNNRIDAGRDAAPWVYQRPPVPEGAILLETPEFVIPPGAESNTCIYTSVYTSAEVYTREIHSYQAPGGHHAVVFYTEEPQPADAHPCTDSDMNAWRFIGGGQESMESALSLPDGVGLRIPGQKQLVIQSHYVNTDSVPHTVRDAIVIVPTPRSSIQHIADSYNIFDPDIALPPHATYGRTLDCTLDADMTFVTALGHTHAWGTRAAISLVQAGTSRTIYDEVGGLRLEFSPPVHVFTGTNAIVAHAGDHLLLSCDWNNTTERTLTVPEEMCAALLYYYPGNGAILCENVTETRSSAPLDGGTDAGSTNGNAGCSTPWTPADQCVRPCNTGNEVGVGRYCTPGGHECVGHGSAFICTADVVTGDTWGFCTKPCSSVSSCGSGTVCTGDSSGMGCVPVECVAGDDAGTDAGSASDSGAGDSGVSTMDAATTD